MVGGTGPDYVVARLLVCCWCLWLSQGALATSWQDDAGTTWGVPAQLPVRWVVLGPHLIDEIQVLGLQSRVVGALHDHPQPGRETRTVDGFPVVGQPGRLSEEALRRARPDLVVYWPSGLSVAEQQRLQRLRLPLLAIEPRRLSAIPERLLWLGRLGGPTSERLAHQQAQHAREILARTVRRPAHAPRVFYQAWPRPLYTVSQQHLISQAITHCGGSPIMPATAVAAPVVSIEFVLRQNPEVMLVPAPQQAESERMWRRFPRLAAVRTEGIRAVDAERLARPGLGLIHYLSSLCRLISHE